MNNFTHIIKWLRDSAGHKRSNKRTYQKEFDLKNVLRLAQVGVWEWIADSKSVVWPAELFRISDRNSPLSAEGNKTLSQMLTPESWSKLSTAVDTALEEICRIDTRYSVELPLIRLDGKTMWIALQGEAKRSPSGLISGAQGIVQDITDRKAIHDALIEEKERSHITLNSIGDAVLSTNNSGNITYLNGVAEKMTGWSLPDALGRPLAEVFKIISRDTREPMANPLDAATRTNAPVGLAMSCILIGRDGTEIPIEDSTAPIHDAGDRIVGAVIVFRDVSKSQAMTLKMSHLAQHDFLTNLPNRVLLNDRLVQAISLAHRHSTQLALLFLDLDHFKHINDTLGHGIGDQLLVSIAERLKTCLRGSDTVSRQGGDEFVILLPVIEHAVDATKIAENVLAALAAPHSIARHDLYVTVSIGISLYPDDGQDAETLLKNADVAMYCAKSNGRNNFQLFTQKMHCRSSDRQSIENSLRHAFEQNEFVLHYQPKVNLATGETIGAEAFIRWQHPHHGLVSPDYFISIAEESGLILPIGRWVLHETCRQIRAWQEAGLRSVPISINISALEFRGEHFIENVRATLKHTRIDPRFLEIELTESVLMRNAESAVTVLKELKNLGVQIAVDDFGTGYSSLSYLGHFPIDVVKIDQSFVHGIATHSNNATVISAVIGMCNGLKCKVIAEGVETQEQAEFLHAGHCVEAQGYYFGRPMDSGKFAKLLADDPEYQ
jgi:diguanylate cyclase (GGDEF)-like protein/PAS domain S-box-containing protein